MYIHLLLYINKYITTDKFKHKLRLTLCSCEITFENTNLNIISGEAKTGEDLESFIGS